MLKVKNKVKLINACLHHYGEEAIIIGIKASDMFPYLLKFNDGYIGQYCEHDLQLIEEEKGMNKSELKSGRTLVQDKGGCVYIFINDDFIDKHGSYLELCEYKDDLTDKSDNCWDIVKVAIYESAHYAMNKFLHQKDEVIQWTWERQEPKKMTKEEIEKELGYKINIISKED
jgi:hypothetical protein